MSKLETQAFLRTGFQLWSTFAQTKRRLRNLKIRAAVLCKLKLYQKTLTSWRLYNRKRRTLRTAALQIQASHSIYLQHLALASFIYYLVDTYAKKQRHAAADTCFAKLLLRRSLQAWQRLRGAVQARAQQVAGAQQKACFFLQRRVFRWLQRGVAAEQSWALKKLQSQKLHW